MKPRMKGEKRRHPRFPAAITMDIRADGHRVGKVRGTIADLSVGGMALRTNAELEPGMSLYLKINIPLEIRGEIRHSKNADGGGLHRYGVRFHKIGLFEPDAAKPGHFISAKFEKAG